MRTLSLGLGAAAGTFVVLFAIVGALYLVQLFGALSLFLGSAALWVGTAIWLHQNQRRLPEGIASLAVLGLLIAAVLLLLWVTQPTYVGPPMMER